MVAERKKVDRLVISQTSTPESVPLPSYRYGRERVVHHTRLFLRRKSSDAGDIFSLSKPAGNVGQQAKDKLRICYSQAHKMTFVLK
ncbi:hypothetical protein UF12_09495 [Acinetobacter calcoaceticus]|nr:hypothetical protein UF12_09495 [Acinetobacter calcoaceticus]